MSFNMLKPLAMPLKLYQYIPSTEVLVLNVNMFASTIIIFEEVCTP